MLTEAVALEARDTGVRVYDFQPNVVDTDMQGAGRDSGMNEISKLPCEQLASPRERARAIARLCTVEAANMADEELSIQDPVFRRQAGLEN